MPDIHAEREIGRMEEIIRQQHREIDALKQDADHWKQAFNSSCEACEKMEEELEDARIRLNERCPVEALENGMTLVEAAVWHVWGDRCSEFDPECNTCLAWAEFDER